jgi:hypothetical protein
MADDIFGVDPFRGFDPFRGMSVGGGGPRSQATRPLPPEQSASMIGTLGSNAMSGLQYLGQALDKPGRAVRGVLGGKAREALSILPFSDSLGITNHDQRVSGRDLTNKIGLTRRADNGWGAWGTGLAAEIATDPLTYLTVGAKSALTPAGQALKDAGALKGFTRKHMLQGFEATEPALLAAGKSPEQIAHAIAQGQRIASTEHVAAAAAKGLDIVPGQALSGIAGFGVPFRNPSVTFGTGKASQAVASGMDKAGDFLRYGNPLGRQLGAMFDPSANGAVDALTQRAWATHGTPALDTHQALGRQQSYNLIEHLNPLIEHSGLDERAILAGVTQAGENIPLRVPGPNKMGVEAQILAAGDLARGIGEGQMAQARKLGLPLQDSGDKFISYLPRRSVNVTAKAGQVRGDNLFPVSSGSNIHRDELYRNIPGGSTRIDDWAQRFAGDKSSKGIIRAIKKDMALDFMSTGQKMTRELGKQFDVHADELASRFSHMNEAHKLDQIPLYSPDIVGSIAKRGEQHARTIASAHAALGGIGDNARLVSQLGGDHVTVPELLGKLHAITRPGDKAAGILPEGALVEAYRRLARAGAGPVEPIMAGGGINRLRKEASKYGLSTSDAEKIVKSYTKWATPEEIKAPIKLFDSMTNAFKGLTYPLWPASHVRNAVSAALNNSISGTSAAAYKLQHGLMRGTATAGDIKSLIPHFPGNMTDEAARDWLRGQQFSSAKIFGGHNSATEQAGHVIEALQTGDRITPMLPGSGRAGDTGSLVGDVGQLLGGAAKDQAGLIGGKLRHPIAGANPFEMSGVFGGTKDFPLLDAGRKVGTNIEDFFRGANWNHSIARGATPSQASASVAKYHFDYDKLTKFEKNVMKRLVPFYTFARKNLPLQAELAATRPALASVQTKLMSNARDKDAYVPEYLAGGGAVPIGDGPDGTKRYISGFGTPLEEAMDRFRFKGGLPDVKNTLLQLAAQGNPILKAPIEQLFNTQFHTGRKLTDLAPPRSVAALSHLVSEDNPQLLSQILVNSPLSRFVTAADKMIDERKPWWSKALNLGSGVRITDVDEARQRSIEARKALESILSGSPRIGSHTSLYVKPGEQDNLTSIEATQLQLLNQFNQEARKYSAQHSR